MRDDSFQDACLVLVGHGSSVNVDSSAPLRQLIAEFQRRSCFSRAVPGFWKEEPLLSNVLEGIQNGRVFIVPFFISEGYFTEEVVPRDLGLRRDGQREFPRVLKRGAQTLFYCQPVGTHANMTSVVLSRARSVVEQHPFPRKPPESDITLFIAGHGTSRNEQSRMSVEVQVDLVGQRGHYAGVHAVFLEEKPGIADCYALASTRHIVMVPFFLSDGLHVREDIPVLLGESEARVRERHSKGQPTWRNPTEKRSKLVWCSGAVGTDPVVAEVILDRVREASFWREDRVC